MDSGSPSHSKHTVLLLPVCLVHYQKIACFINAAAGLCWSVKMRVDLLQLFVILLLGGSSSRSSAVSSECKPYDERPRSGGKSLTSDRKVVCSNMELHQVSADSFPNRTVTLWVCTGCSLQVVTLIIYCWTGTWGCLWLSSPAFILQNMKKQDGFVGASMLYFCPPPAYCMLQCKCKPHTTLTACVLLTQEDILGCVQEPLVLSHLQVLGIAVEAPCCAFLYLEI